MLHYLESRRLLTRTFPARSAAFPEFDVHQPRSPFRPLPFKWIREARIAFLTRVGECDVQEHAIWACW
jgi:hypothetical protein